MSLTAQTAAAEQAVNPDSVESLLLRLKRSIQSYAAIEGGSKILGMLGIAFWVSLGCDYSLEMPRLVRVLLLILVSSLGVGLLFSLVLFRVWSGFRDRSLALLLEHRFPQLADRLITIVEMRNRQLGHLSTAMIERTAIELAPLTENLAVSAVFDQRPIRRALTAAVAAVVSVAGFAAIDLPRMTVWAQRNILLSDIAWPRTTDIRLAVLSQPGERRVEFRDRVYKHPRGSDLTLLATVPEGKRAPSRVQLAWRIGNQSTTGREDLARFGSSEFRHTLPGWQDDIQLWVRGGDYVSRDPYIVRVVDPPRVDVVAFDCLYPKHTGRNRMDAETGDEIRDLVLARGTQVNLPAGTDAILRIRSNKPLQSCRIACAGLEIELRRGTAIVRPGSAASAVAGTTGSVTSPAIAAVSPIAGSTTAATTEPPPPVAEMTLPAESFRMEPDGRSVLLHLTLDPDPAAAGKLSEPVAQLPLPAETQFRIWLHDEDDIQSSEPLRLQLTAVPDGPPVVDSRIRAISGSVTRQASIPVLGTVTDDYGVTNLQFAGRVEGEPTDREQPFRKGATGLRSVAFDERFDLASLGLPLGSKLSLQVAATDGDSLTGPHRSLGERFTFTVVSNEELLAVISARELNMRRRLEQVLEELKRMRADFSSLRIKWNDFLAAENSKPGTTVEERRIALLASTSTLVDRSVIGIRKSANESSGLEQAFREVREELLNNAVPDVQNILSRLDFGVISPLQAINNVNYNSCDAALQFLREATTPAEFAGRTSQVFDQFELLIVKLEAVLAQMLKEEGYGEVVQSLREVIEEFRKLQEETKSERKRRLIEGLQ